MFLSKPIPVVRGSNPMLSDSSIRRLKRQRNISQRCRNQNAGLSGPMRRTRLPLRGRHRFPIGFSFLKHPETGFREMARDGHFCLAVATPGLNPLVKPADLIVATALSVKQRTVSRLDKGPLQIHIDIAAYRSKANLPPTGVLPRHQPAVAGEPLGTAEALNGADLGPNHHRQNLAYSRLSLKQGGLGTRRKNFDHFCFDRFEILAHVIELIEYASERLFGVGRKLYQKFGHDLTSTLAKGIARPLHPIPVLAQCGMHAIFKLRSLATKHHAGARQFACITNRGGGDPHRRQGAGSLQPVHPFSIELVALIDAAHHQFSQPRIDQLRFSPSGLDLIDHPVPVPDCLHSHRRSFTPSMNKILDRSTAMRQPALLLDPSSYSQPLHYSSLS